MVIVFLNRSEVRSLALLVGLFLLGFASVVQWRHFQTQGSLSKLTVVIDPGHGGVDGGTQDDRGNLEKHVNLQIGLETWKQLQQSGLNVLLTRQTDTDLAPFRSGRGGRHRKDLLQRIEIARRSKSLFLVSIHCDYLEGARKRGAFVFFNYRSAISKGLAGAIQDEVNRLQEKPGKIAPGKYLVIREPDVTGVLVEVGYLSHPEEAALLQTKDYQSKIGLAIARGILNYCQGYVR